MSLKEKIKKIIPKSLLQIYHLKLAFLGALIFGFPGKNLPHRVKAGKNLKIIGVTGTSGKSTTVDFITRILEEAGNKVASLSSIRFKIGDKEWENKYKMTMPGRLVIQKFLRQALNSGCQYVVLEVTSEGIRQFRHKFIDFDAAVFTNLTPEHIESHGGFENYRNEKLKLFKVTKNIHIVNVDDENAKYFLDIPAERKIIFSINDVKNINLEKGISFEFEGKKFSLRLSGKFNIYNALAAISVAKVYGIGLEVCKKALEEAKKISGRMETVSENPKVFVDYAHTPAQLEEVYKTLAGSNLICVLGACGGGRDRWKRPVLGKIAAKYCKEIIITNEDPYDEDPSQILSMIKSGISKSKFQMSNFYEILDRREAIRKALQLAKPNDIVIITGKGCEPWMCVANGRKIPWDDRQVVREELKKIFTT